MQCLQGRPDPVPCPTETTECAAHAERQRRRETLSRWLEKACLPAAQRELQLHLDQDYLQTIFTYLTVRQVSAEARLSSAGVEPATTNVGPNRNLR